MQAVLIFSLFLTTLETVVSPPGHLRHGPDVELVLLNSSRCNLTAKREEFERSHLEKKETVSSTVKRLKIRLMETDPVHRRHRPIIRRPMTFKRTEFGLRRPSNIYQDVGAVAFYKYFCKAYLEWPNILSF